MPGIPKNYTDRIYEEVSILKNSIEGFVPSDEAVSSAGVESGNLTKDVMNLIAIKNKNIMVKSDG